MDLRDIRVVEAGKDLRFPLEPSKPVWVGCKEVGEDLQRDIPVELGVAGAIHLTHTAFADLGGHFVRTDSVTSRQCHMRLGPSTLLGVYPVPVERVETPFAILLHGSRASLELISETFNVGGIDVLDNGRSLAVKHVDVGPVL